MVSGTNASIGKIRKWSGWPRVRSTATVFLVLLVAAARPECPGIHVALGRAVILVVALSLLVTNGKDRYALLSAAGLIGFGLVWLRDICLGWALPLAGGGMFLVGLALWWIDKYVPDN